MWMEGGDLMLSGKAAAYAGGAAIAGGISRFVAEGDYRWVALAQNIVGAGVGWCFVVASTIVYPSILENVWVFGAMVYLAAFLVMPFLKIVFWRIEHEELSMNLGPIKANSDGKEPNE